MLEAYARLIMVRGTVPCRSIPYGGIIQGLHGSSPERWGPVGSYLLQGHYPRLLDVLVEGIPGPAGHDLAKVGFAAADVQTLESLVKDGALDLESRAEDGEAFVSAIEVQKKER